MSNHENKTCEFCGCPAAGDRCRDHRERAREYTGKRRKATLVPEE